MRRHKAVVSRVKQYRKALHLRQNLQKKLHLRRYRVTSENAEAAVKAAALKDAGVDEKDVLAISIHKDYDDGHEAYDVRHIIQKIRILTIQLMPLPVLCLKKKPRWCRS